MLDLIIKNAQTLTQKNMEIGIKNGRIKTIAPEIKEETAKEIQLSDKQYISAGWIDDHVHCFEKMDLYYDYPDKVGVETGVTTVIDAGTTGAENIHQFYPFAQKAKTNVFALINISKTGIIAQNELADLTNVQSTLVQQAIQSLPNFIVGIKARMSQTVVGENGIAPLESAKQIQEDNQGIPLMVHIGSAPPELYKTLELMEQGDILTHCFNGKTNGILAKETDTIRPFVWEAYHKGIIFDVGHGTDSFNFHVAQTAFNEGMKASSISTDIYIRNRKKGPVYDMATTLTKLHVIGYSWEEILKKITIVPAHNFHLNTKGELKEGFDADITVFEFHETKKRLVDSNGEIRTAYEEINPVKTIIGGKVYDN